MNTGIKIGTDTISFKHVTHASSLGNNTFKVYLDDGTSIQFSDEGIYQRIVNWLITGHPVGGQRD